ncbi:HNH endonuclease signature motif containing protein [Candidatus Poriferisodalis sp.]|uniref:HNH endonuclease signature motif containing protein n=1 Tax=Candidatus Poriferisodalis sp. TaxID=3101277 RepID=UPI003B51E92B
MNSASRPSEVGSRGTPRRPAVSGACLVELRARLVRRCKDDSGDGNVVRRAVESAVGSVAGAGPLVDAKAVRSAHDEDLVWCAQSVQRAINMLEGARSSLAAEVVRRQLHARRGEASGAETLVNATAVGGALARRIEREAQALGAHPPVAESLGRGEITSDQAAVVAAADVPDDVRSDLCKQARNQTADQTRQTVRSAEAAWRRESEAQRHARQRAARSASMWIYPNDGMWHLRAKFDALTGDAINRLLISAIERNWRSDKDLPESKRRSVQQRAADALAWLLTSAGVPGAGVAGGDGATPSGALHAGAMPRVGAADGGALHADAMPRVGAADGGALHAGATPWDAAAADGAPGAGRASRGASGAGSAARDAGGVVGEGLRDDGWVVPSPTQMIVLTTLDNLRGASAGRQPDAGCTGAASIPVRDLLAVPGAVATTETGTVLGVADARKIACDTRVIPVVMSGLGEVLDVGRATRTIPPAIRRALIARDQGCVWPGCDRAPIHCDGHHIQHWLDDGPTSLVNLALLCHSHHHRLHKYNLMLHPPQGPAPPGEGWTVTPAPPRKARTPATDRVRQNC